MTKIEFTPQFKKALDQMEKGNSHLFITGRAGTGKSTLLTCFRQYTNQKIAVLAPTGVAAVNVNGVTIHSFFKFRPDITVEKVRKEYGGRDREGLFKKLDAIVIDEISMVRADLLDCIDAFLRLNGPDKRSPFGGIRLILIGDLYQLPPVVSKDAKELFSTVYEGPYFFNARVFEDIRLDLLELEKIFRQSDPDFIAILNAVRNRTVTEHHLALLNTRVVCGYQPTHGDGNVMLTTKVDMAEMINQDMLSRLKGKPFQSDGVIRGEFEKRSLPAPESLRLKKGAQVMLTANDSAGRYVNGSIGIVRGTTSVEDEDRERQDAILVELESGEEVEVLPNTWQMYKYTVKKGSVETETIGSYTQFPMILAWAITIHKSQGKTFDRVVIDFGGGTFAHGQAYVALSRCRTLSGITLCTPFTKRQVLMDWRVVKFLTRFKYDQAHEEQSIDDIESTLSRAIREKSGVRIVYLKASDEKSERTITPLRMEVMEYKGIPYPGLLAFCHTRQEERVFRVDRILSAQEIQE